MSSASAGCRANHGAGRCSGQQPPIAPDSALEGAAPRQASRRSSDRTRVPAGQRCSSLARETGARQRRRPRRGAPRRPPRSARRRPPLAAVQGGLRPAAACGARPSGARGGRDHDGQAAAPSASSPPARRVGSPARPPGPGVGVAEAPLTTACNWRNFLVCCSPPRNCATRGATR